MKEIWILGVGAGPHFGLHLNLQSDKDVNNYNLHVNESCEADFSQPTGANIFFRQEPQEKQKMWNTISAFKKTKKQQQQIEVNCSPHAV